MKILYHHRIRSLDGQSVHLMELVGSLRKLGHEVVLVGPVDPDRASFGADAGFVARLKTTLPKAAYEVLELGYSIVAYRRLARAIREHDPDAVYERYNLFAPAGVIAAGRAGLPLLLEVNAPLYEERATHDGIGLGWLARWSERFVWRRASRVLPVTDVLADYVRAAGVTQERISVVPNGISEAFRQRSPGGREVRDRYGIGDRIVLGFTGFVREWHGLDRVIDLIASSADRERLALLVAGEGPAIPALKEQARRLGVEGSVIFAGLIERHEMPGFVSAFDVALQPAVTAYASPLKLFEYMGVGCAIVAPNQPNIREILTDAVDALLFDPADPQAFAGAVRRLIGNDELRARLGAAAHATVEAKGLFWDENARRVIAMIEDLRAPAR